MGCVGLCDEVHVPGYTGGRQGELNLLAACGIGNRMMRPVYHPVRASGRFGSEGGICAGINVVGAGTKKIDCLTTTNLC